MSISSRTVHSRRRAASVRFTTLTLVLGWAGALPAAMSAQEPEGFGDPERLTEAGPLRVAAVVDWDELITETAGGATPDQFHQAVFQTFEAALEEAGVSLDPAALRTLLCRVETIYQGGLIAYAARVELHEPVTVDGKGLTAITWHRTWIGSAPVQEMHRLFAVGEQCAADFLEAGGR